MKKKEKLKESIKFESGDIPKIVSVSGNISNPIIPNPNNPGTAMMSYSRLVWTTPPAPGTHDEYLFATVDPDNPPPPPAPLAPTTFY